MIYFELAVSIPYFVLVLLDETWQIREETCFTSKVEGARSNWFSSFLFSSSCRINN